MDEKMQSEYLMLTGVSVFDLVDGATTVPLISDVDHKVLKKGEVVGRGEIVELIDAEPQHKVTLKKPVDVWTQTSIQQCERN